MWEQAKARAAETGSVVVWCDGGKGGISGIATGAYSEIIQVGPGSWAKSLSFSYPFNEARTVYTWGGSTLAFIIVWSVTGIGAGIQVAWRLVSLHRLGGPRFIGSIIQRIKARSRVAGPTEETSLLG